MSYTNYQIDALKQLKETVEYLSDVGLSIKACMQQGCGLVYVVKHGEDDIYDDELDTNYIQDLIDTGDE